MNTKIAKRIRRKAHIRKDVFGTSERPRLTVFRSNAHIYAQLIDDVAGKTVVQASDVKSKGTNVEKAKQVGEQIAKAALAAKVNTVTFDRNGYRYHGRVKALADAAREGGLNF